MNASVQNVLLFVALPYAALAILLVGTMVRVLYASQTITSRSTQFLEGERHVWALPAFHFGIIVMLLGHLAGIITPARMHVWTASPLRLHVIEVVGLAAALLALAGIALIISRRFGTGLVRVTTAPADILVLLLLAFQLCTGIYVAVSLPWGAAWFEALVGPYVRSLLALNPDVSYVGAMPAAIKVHLVGAWGVVAIFPFTRLIHMIVVPFPYLWRKFQLVRWTQRRIPIATSSAASAVARGASAGR
jgi:nitrate reductase gamma subunit